MLNRRQFLTSAGAGGACSVATAASAAEAGLARAPRDLPEGAVGMLIDSTLCIGCQACVSACRSANGVVVDDTPFAFAGWNAAHTWNIAQDLDGETLNVIRLWRDGTGEVKDRETDGFAFGKRHCLHCVDPSCVSVCPVQAMQKDPVTGIVSYDPEACIGCRYCSYGCPFGVPQFDLRAVFGQINKCQMCRHLLAEGKIPACCDVCPTGASLFGPVELLQAEADRRLTAEPGSTMLYPRGDITQDRPGHMADVPVYLEHTYGEHEVGGTQVRYLAAVAFEKIGLPEVSDVAPARLSEGLQHTLYNWMIAPTLAFLGAAFVVRRNRLKQARDEGEEV